MTYEALLAVDNADLSLRPGMSATAEITVDAVADALRVPNSAFRFAPPARDLEGENSGLWGRLAAWTRGADDRPQGLPDPPTEPNQRILWVLHDGRPAAFTVTTGPSDGALTVVREGGLEAGMAVIVSGGSVGR
ncbi:MAG TPA: hypothetical protein EYP07_01400 [Kiloniellaceae bacterium]|nr:hypothetical protein [Kiloniellaceae bacterium]